MFGGHYQNNTYHFIQELQPKYAKNAKVGEMIHLRCIHVSTEDQCKHWYFFCEIKIFNGIIRFNRREGINIHVVTIKLSSQLSASAMFSSSIAWRRSSIKSMRIFLLAMVFHGHADMMFVGGETFTLWRISPIATQQMRCRLKLYVKSAGPAITRVIEPGTMTEPCDGRLSKSP
jgi:hypothetical protein